MTFSKYSTPTLRIGLICAATMIGGCDSKSTTTADTSTLLGEININGSSTVLPISNAIKELFEKSNPKVDIKVSGDGTGNGFKDFYAKRTDMSDASRPIKPGEFEKCKEAGVEFVELPVAYDGLTIAVHPDNDWAQQLTVADLKQMFVGQQHAQTWKEVNDSWPDEEIKIYAPGTGSGTYDYFREVVTKGEEEELHQNMNLNEDDNILVQGVAGNKYSIGFFGVAYYEANKDTLKAVKIVNPKDGNAYLPTSENIAANKYAPFSRPLFIYVNTASLNRAEVQAFVHYYLDTVSDVVKQVGYVRLPAEIIETGRANLDSLVVGTHFVDGEGNSRSGSLAENFVADNLTK